MLSGPLNGEGFAIGRTIFGDAARAWLSGTITDAQAVEDMATRYISLCTVWDQARAGQRSKR